MASLIYREDYIHALGLTKLHVGVLQLDATVSWKELINLIPRESIDDMDSMKRTALSWAAQREDVDQIRSLLIKGADPNTHDIREKSPLMYCSNDPQCLSLLLQAGADPNLLDCQGYSMLCRLIHRTDDTSSAEILLAWGADLNLRKNDLSAIKQTLQRYRPRTLRWLLDHEVELEFRGICGETPFLEFLSNTGDEHPDMLEMLLEKKPQCLDSNDYHEGLLHHVARFSGSRYMRTFQQKADLSNLDTEQRSISGTRLWEKCSLGMTAHELAEWRRDHQAEWASECGMPLDPDPVAWFVAFTIFVGSIKAAQEPQLRKINNSSASSSTSVLPDERDEGESGKMDHHVSPKVPGAYPPECDGQCSEGKSQHDLPCSHKSQRTLK